MNCLKCGREIASRQVFCQDCLLDMEKYPVKPGTVVQIPKRPDAPAARKTAKRRNVSAEEQILSLRKKVRVLVLMLIVSVLLGCVLFYFAAEYWREDHFLPGQNYSSIVVTTGPAEAIPEAAG